MVKKKIDKTSSKFVITSAQAHAQPNKKFVKGLETYAADTGAELIVLPMIGQSAREDIDQLDPYFDNKNVEFGKKKLNSNIMVEQFNVRPYQIDPITGLKRFAQKGTSLIFASPKQRLMPIPHSMEKMPKFLMTTGAVTLPNYATGRDVSAERRRLGDISTRDHVYGAMVVEVADNKKYHFRNIRALKNGKFVDLGDKYDGSRKSKASLEAMVLGDWHNGHTDEKAKEATYKMISDLKPKRIFLHDFFDGHSVSHWSDKSPIQEKLLQLYDNGLLHLDEELKQCYNELERLSDVSNGAEINVVASNHLTFLNRYLEEFRFRYDMSNLRTATKLLTYMAAKDYNNPVEAGIKMHGDLGDNVRFLRSDEDYKVQGYQVGAHGDKGPSGGRGSVLSKEADFGKSVTGHVHKAQILRDTYTVGTMSSLDQYFIRGQPTDWTTTHGLVWDNKNVQLVNIVEGEYRL